MSGTTVLVLAYDGAPFSGFARQAGRATVQGRLEEALATALRRDVVTECAGRTDAGVHALGQVVSFPSAEGDPSGAELLRSLNALAGPEIVVREARSAPAGFSARHDALSREYRYRLVPGPVPPLFLRGVAWWAKGALDIAAMREASEALVGEHDFASFCVAETAQRVRETTSIGTVRSIDLLELGTACELGESHLVVRVAGRAFLHSMVRIVVGTLVEVGRGKRPPAWTAEVLAAKDRAAAGRTAPAHGLTLWHVAYEDGVWL
ncbi:MAG TPA: tRNA pseudouridine(38-40) synthase TruA [Coriobacteriia bacterium]|jgi:tRNA pseudouridine38-40 synthase